MRIVRVTSFYRPALPVRSPMIRELGTGYTRAGHDFVVISPGSRFARTQTPYGTLITVPWRLVSDGRRSLVPLAFAVRRLLDELQPDRLEVSDRLTLRALGAWAQEHNVPSVAILDDVPAPWVLRALGTAGYQDVVGATGRGIADAAALSYLDVIRVPHGVDLEVFTPLRWSADTARVLRDGGDVVFVCAGGSHSPGAGSAASGAMRELLRRGVNARLVALDDTMVPLDRATVLASADVFIATGAINTAVPDALEALASGTPVVAPADSPVMELISGHSGDGAAPGTLGLADALSRVLAVRVEDRRTAARQTAAGFPWHATVDGMLALHSNSNDLPLTELAVPLG
jgi:alpha-1,6-mannosyltransferase